MKHGAPITEGRSDERCVLVDAHVHYHPCYDPVDFLDGAAANVRTNALTEERNARDWTGLLLLADTTGQQTLRRFDDQAAALSARGWHWLPTGEPTSRRAFRDDGTTLLMLAGRQVVSAERLELLALASVVTMPDGLPLEEMLRRSAAAGALVVLPWGFGKWWFRRRRVLIDLLVRRRRVMGEHELFLGDNGGRPHLSHPTMLRQLVRRFRLRLLPGSDPLPFASHVSRAGRRGFVLRGDVDLARPAGWLRERLAQRREQPECFGHGESLVRFSRDQLAMQFRKLKRASPVTAGCEGAR